MPVLTCVVLKTIGKGGESYRTARVLLGILDGDAEGNRVAGMEDQAELGSTLPSQAHLVVRVHVLRIEDVRRHNSYASSTGREHAPVLSTEKFEFALAVVDEIETRAQGVGIAGDVQVVVGEAQEVGLDIANDVSARHRGIDSQSDPRVLHAEVIFGKRGEGKSDCRRAPS